MRAIAGRWTFLFHAFAPHGWTQWFILHLLQRMKQKGTFPCCLTLGKWIHSLLLVLLIPSPSRPCLFLFFKNFQICPCLPAIPAVQDTMIATAGEVYIFLRKIPLFGKTENEDNFRHLPKVLLFHPYALFVCPHYSSRGLLTQWLQTTSGAYLDIRGCRSIFLLLLMKPAHHLAQCPIPSKCYIK